MARPIAITAVELLLPGGVDSLDQLQQALLAATPHVGQLPPGPRHGSWSAPPPAAWAQGIEHFDPSLFGLSLAEATLLDPRHRLLLTGARRALHASGALDHAQRCGVFLGLGASEYRELCPPGDPRTATGTESSTAAGRIAHTFDLGGPTLVVDTACSSALVALHLAVRALRSGDCTVALVGAAHLIGSPAGWERLARTGILSPTHRCRPLDQGADGTVRGEGGGLLVLQPLDEAERAGAAVIGVIAGTAIGHDGAAAGLTVPNGPAQQRVVQAALRDAGLSPDDLCVLEAHATGTALGDPIEMASLQAVFGDRSVPVTATKAVFGHLEAAAGLVGLLAALAALRAGTAPRIATLHNPSERLPDRGPRPAAEDVALPEAGYAGVSAFGLSGTNAHVVLRAGPDAPPTTDLPQGQPVALWVSSAPPVGAPAEIAQPEDVRGAIAAVLGGDPARIPAERSLFEIGLDSVGAAELARRLDVPVATIFEHPTLASLQARHGGRPSRHATASTRSSSPVAIVAAACRFPGGVTDLASYFELLCSDRDPVGPAPPGRDVTGPGGFLDDVFGFDPEAFELSTREASVMDPQQRLWLEVAAEVVERGGLRDADLAQTGLFVGAAESQYLRAWEEPDVGVGNEGSFVAGRSAHVLGLGGPVMTLNTACSASLVAVHTAVRALADGECTAAIAGGVSLLLSQAAQQMLGALGVLSPSGRCHSFDRRADGYVRGEGAAAVLLMRLDEALDRGHEVLAVVRGSAVAHDGRTGGVAVPGPGAWRRVVSRALAHADLQGDDIGYVEAHGSATPLGDAIEVRTLGEALAEAGRSGPVWTGSVKSRLGHLEQAAGMAGLLKVVAMLQHGCHTPNLHFEALGPELPRGVVRVPTRVQPWDGPRVAGVSAFGISGTAAHVIVAAPPVQRPTEAARAGPVWLPLSARTSAGLVGLAKRVATAIEGGQAPADVARTLATRAPRAVRASLVAPPDELSAILRHPIPVEAGTPKVAWVFSGAGPQRPAMGSQLPGLEAWLSEHASAVHDVLGPGLREVLTTDDDRIGDIAWTVVATTALQLFLVERLRSWGLAPHAVAGHSFGEISAAHTAGVLTAADALRLAALRGARMQQVPATGQLLVVRTNADTVRATLGDGVDVAAVNGPEETVLSGPRAALQDAARALGVDVHWLQVDRAWHSHAVQPVVRGFVEDLAGLTLRPPTLPLHTGLDGQLAADRAADPAHWGALLRSTVQFHATVQALTDTTGCDAFLEVGPHPALLASVAATTGLGPERLLPTLHRDLPPDEALLRARAGLWALGSPIEPRDHLRGGRIRSDVPTAPLERRPLRAPREETPTRSVPHYAFTWEPLDPLAPLGEPAAGPWAVLGTGPVAEALAEALRSSQRDVVRTPSPDVIGVVVAPQATTPQQAVLDVLAAARDTPPSAHLVVASSGPPGAVQGAARALAWERPRVTALTVDPAAHVTALGWERPELWWRPDGPHAPRYVQRAPPTPPVRVQGTWIVIGGFGVLGRGLAERLVARGAARVVVAGPRVREVPEPLEIAQLDATDAEGLRALLTRLGAVQGVVLAAGVLHDARVGELTDADAQRVLAPKLGGLAALQVSANQVPQWLLLSSASGWVGSPGQLPYSAANAALDAVAVARQARGQHACSVALGPVADAGMAAAVGPALRAQHAALGIEALPLQAALDALERGLSPQAPPQLGVFDVDWSRLPHRAAVTAAPSAGRAPPAAADAVAEPTSADAVQDIILEVANQHLRKPIPDVDTDLIELGLDSMTALTLRNALAQRGVDLPVALVMTGPSVSELVLHAAPERPAPAVTRPTQRNHAPPAPPMALALALSLLVLVAAVGLLMAQA
ncbi:MAG: acyltransferase domain-containing protein [Myxococcales bacterium]|nr:acyltransferase domain-containing protein [Myxococcales bacterium]